MVLKDRSAQLTTWSNVTLEQAMNHEEAIFLQLIFRATGSARV